jgi:hypothetical protein
VRYGRITGLVFCVVGFVAIGFGWNGMAKVACPDCQLPYLLSGGAAGLGLIVLGSVLLLMAQVRDDRIKLADQIKDMGAVVSRAASAAGPAGPAGAVVAGKSTYHLPTCRLVEGKADVDLVSVEVARLQGLSPCRVCNPPAPGNGSATQSTGDAATEASTEASGTSTRGRKSTAKSSGRK